MGKCYAQSKETIDSLRLKLPLLEKNDSLYFEANAKYFIDYYLSSNIDSSIYFIQKSIEISKRNKWLSSEIGYYTTLAFAYNVKGLVFKAIDINFKALLLAQKNKKYKLTYPIQRVLGESYLNLKKYEKSDSLLNLAYLGAIKNNDPYEIIAARTASGNSAKEQNKLEKAEKFYRECIEMSSKIKDTHLTGITFHNLASILAARNNYKEAFEYFDRSLKLHQAENHFYSLGNVSVDLSEVYFKLKKLNVSIQKANDALAFGQKANSPEIISKANYWLYKNYSLQGNTPKALTFFEKYISLKDSLNQDDFERRIKSLQLEYDIAQNETKIVSQNIQILKKSNENLILQKNRNLLFAVSLLIFFIACFLIYNRWRLRRLNTVLENKVKVRTIELEEANEGLIRKNQEISEALFKGQNIERKRVAIELHDNLSSILSAVKMSLSAIKTNNFTENEKKIYDGVKAMMGNAYNEVRNISHNIMPEELEAIGLTATLRKIIERINTAETLSIIFEDGLSERLDPKVESNLYSISLELINNAIKHSCASIVRFSLQKVDSVLILKFSDNGQGISTEAKNGMGLNNIKSRIEAINGQLNIKSKPNIGTEFSITLPL